MISNISFQLENFIALAFLLSSTLLDFRQSIWLQKKKEHKKQPESFKDDLITPTFKDESLSNETWTEHLNASIVWTHLLLCLHKTFLVWFMTHPMQLHQDASTGLRGTFQPGLYVWPYGQTKLISGGLFIQFKMHVFYAKEDFACGLLYKASNSTKFNWLFFFTFLDMTMTWMNLHQLYVCKFLTKLLRNSEIISPSFNEYYRIILFCRDAKNDIKKISEFVL